VVMLKTKKKYHFLSVFMVFRNYYSICNNYLSPFYKKTQLVVFFSVVVT